MLAAAGEYTKEGSEQPPSHQSCSFCSKTIFPSSQAHPGTQTAVDLHPMQALPDFMGLMKKGMKDVVTCRKVLWRPLTGKEELNTTINNRYELQTRWPHALWDCLQ